MDITPRMSQILLLLLQQEQPVSVKHLAEQMGLSKRTIQREMSYMDSVLKEYAICFQSKTGVGIWLEGSLEDKQRLLQALSQDDRLDVSKGEEG